MQVPDPALRAAPGGRSPGPRRGPGPRDDGSTSTAMRSKPADPGRMHSAGPFGSRRDADLAVDLLGPALDLELAREHDRLCPAVDLQLLEDRGHMRLDGRLGDVELVGDLLVELARPQH